MVCYIDCQWTDCLVVANEAISPLLEKHFNFFGFILIFTDTKKNISMGDKIYVYVNYNCVIV